MALYRKRKQALAALADKVCADLICIDTLLDDRQLRPLLCQKLLIPDQLKSYDEILFLDLDVLFRPNIPDPFAAFQEGVGLAAVLQPREDILYADVAINLWRRPQLAWKRKIDYFEEQGLPLVSGLVGPINGGVWLCRPRLLANVYKDAYYNIKKWKFIARHEEPLLAWFPQSMGIFQALPFEYNAQLCFAMFQKAHLQVGKQFSKKWRIILRGFVRHYPMFEMLSPLGGYNQDYFRFVRNCLSENNFVHFSGDMAMPTE